MTDEQTAAAIVQFSTHVATFNDASGNAELEGVILQALQAARKEGAASVVRPPTVAEPTGMWDEDHPNDWCE